MSQITVEDLAYSYHSHESETPAIAHLTFSIASGEVVGLTGASGSGKSTLLKILSGNIRDYTGKALIDGTPPNPKRHSIAFVPQNYGLLPWKRVKENILLPRTLGKDCQRLNELERIVSRLEIAPLLHRYPSELSGGQMQRVALARAFVQSPQLLLMDEPFSALDIATAERSKAIFREFQQELQLTTIIVSHNLHELEGLVSRVLLLGGSPGTLQTDAPMPGASELLHQLLCNISQPHQS